MVVREPGEVPPAGALRWPVDCKCGSGEGGGLDSCAELMFVSEIAEEAKALPFPPRGFRNGEEMKCVFISGHERAVQLHGRQQQRLPVNQPGESSLHPR